VIIIIIDDSRPIPMKNITINIPDQYNKTILRLINLKILPSRSEAVRTAVREFLSEEFSNQELMNNFINSLEVE
jgi:Arc/MetJ-type ribon-helix-helix transcriptional regulator